MPRVTGTVTIRIEIEESMDVDFEADSLTDSALRDHIYEEARKVADDAFTYGAVNLDILDKDMLDVRVDL